MANCILINLFVPVNPPKVVLSSVLLIAGSVAQRRLLLIPWLTVVASSLAFSSVLVLAAMIGQGGDSNSRGAFVVFLCAAPVLALFGYCWLVVYSTFHQVCTIANIMLITTAATATLAVVVVVAATAAATRTRALGPAVARRTKQELCFTLYSRRTYFTQQGVLDN